MYQPTDHIMQRIKVLDLDDEEFLTPALKNAEMIINSYKNRRTGRFEAGYYFTAITSPRAYSYMDSTFLDLIAKTYYDREKQEAYMERGFLFNSDVLEAGSSYAKKILDICEGKDLDSKQRSLHTYCKKEFIEEFGSSFTAEDESYTKIYRPKTVNEPKN